MVNKHLYLRQESGRCFFIQHRGRIVSSNCMPDMPTEPVARRVADSIKKVNLFSRWSHLFDLWAWRYANKRELVIPILSSRSSARIRVIFSKKERKGFVRQGPVLQSGSFEDFKAVGSFPGRFPRSLDTCENYVLGFLWVTSAKGRISLRVNLDETNATNNSSGHTKLLLRILTTESNTSV